MKSKVLYFTLLVALFASCRKPKEEILVSEDLKEWFVDSGNRHFEVCDENGIHQTFRFDGIENDFIENSSSLFGVTYEFTDHEQCGQKGSGFFEDSQCQLHFTAYSDATHVYFKFYDAHFSFNYNESSGIEGTTKCSDGYGEALYGYTIERLDSHEVDGVTYRDVIHIKVVDPDCITRPTFPTEIYYAKHYGPIRYQLARQLWLYRVAE